MSLTIEAVQVLIVKLGSIGDIVHTLPALAAIRAALPSAEISWAVETRSAELLRGNPLIDNLIEVDTRSIREGMSIDEVGEKLGMKTSATKHSIFRAVKKMRNELEPFVERT